MEEKKCNRCGEAKPISMFVRNKKMADGRLNQCKECRNATPRRVYKRNPELKARSRRSYRERKYDQWLANKRVEGALLCGKLTRKPCEVCGATKAHAHHDDYTKPLAVRWLCPKHHAEVHGMLAA